MIKVLWRNIEVWKYDLKYEDLVLFWGNKYFYVF